MKKLIFILVLFLSFAGQAQVNDTTRYSYPAYLYGQRFNKFWATDILNIPYQDTGTWRPQKPGALLIRPADGNLYKWYGGAWAQVSGSGSGQNLSNASLSANGDYGHAWNFYDLSFEDIGLLQFFVGDNVQASTSSIVADQDFVRLRSGLSGDLSTIELRDQSGLTISSTTNSGANGVSLLISSSQAKLNNADPADTLQFLLAENGLMPISHGYGESILLRDADGVVKAMPFEDLPSGGITNLTASDATGIDFTITNPTTTPNISLALTSAAVGLGNVDNTSDANKPVSTATQTALNLKANTSHTHAQSDITSLVSDLAAKQSLDADLTAIAGLSPSANDVLQYKSGAWANRTITQLKTDLAYTISDITSLQSTIDAKVADAINDGTTTIAPSQNAVFDALALKQGNITLTTTGSSGAATLVGSTLNIPQYSGGVAWGGITGTLSSQTDLNTALGLKAPLASPTFTGTVTLPSTTSIGTVSSTEIGYVDGVTSAIQTQIDAKSPTASPTFTGTVTIPSPFTLGATSVTTTGAELNYVSGVTSAIQTQINTKAPTASPTFTGTVVLPSTTSIGTITNTELSYVDGVTSAIQTQIDAKSPSASPTFTGTVVLPSTASIGSVSSTEIGYVDGVTSAIQTQIDTKIAGSAVPTYQRDAMYKIMAALGSTTLYSAFGRTVSDITTTLAMTDGRIYFVPVWISEAGTITGVKLWTTVAGSGNTYDNYNGVGLYTYSAGTYTLVASSTTSSTVWNNAANTFNVIPFSSTYSASQGLHFIAMHYNISAQGTAPSVGALPNLQNAAISSGDITNSSKFSALYSSQASLPSSVSGATISTSAALAWAAVY